MATLERAVMLAAQAHAGQVDKGGAPYLLHPLRLMLAQHGDEARIAAVLHDVVEDSDLCLDDLRREGFSEAVLDAVEALTRRPGESYPEFIARAARDPIARAVKRADLVDNLDLSRIPAPTDQDRARIARYQAALAQLQEIEAAEAAGSSGCAPG